MALGEKRLRYERRRRVWQFPQERFVRYEASDEAWCRFFGIGKEVEVAEGVTISPESQVAILLRRLADCVETKHVRVISVSNPKPVIDSEPVTVTWSPEIKFMLLNQETKNLLDSFFS